MYLNVNHNHANHKFKVLFTIFYLMIWIRYKRKVANKAKRTRKVCMVVKMNNILNSKHKTAADKNCFPLCEKSIVVCRKIHFKRIPVFKYAELLLILHL